MNKQDTSLDDIGQAVTDLGTLISHQIDSSKAELVGNIGRLEVKVDEGFKELKGSLKALENDIKDMYEMLKDVQKDVKSLRMTDKRLDQRLTNLEEFAERLSLKTDIPFQP